MYGKRAFANGRVHIMPNGIELMKFFYDIDACRTVREEYGIPQNAFAVGHIGRFVYQKTISFF